MFGRVQFFFLSCICCVDVCANYECICFGDRKEFKRILHYSIDFVLYYSLVCACI
jgi:hypothetical protein